MMTDKTPKLIFKPVRSSQLKEVAHHGDTLYVRFRNGKVYSYSPVSAEKHDEFMSSESLGSYFHKNFKMNSTLKINNVKP